MTGWGRRHRDAGARAWDQGCPLPVPGAEDQRPVRGPSLRRAAAERPWAWGWGEGMGEPTSGVGGRDEATPISRTRIPSPHLPPQLAIPSHVPHLLARSLTHPPGCGSVSRVPLRGSRWGGHHRQAHTGSPTSGQWSGTCSIGRGAGCRARGAEQGRDLAVETLRDTQFPAPRGSHAPPRVQR